MRGVAGCLAAFVGVAMCACCAALAVASVWAWRQAAAYPDDPAALVQMTQAEVAHLRGLEFKQPVALQMLTPEEMQWRIQRQFEAEWSPQEARDLALTLAAFDLLDPDTDLYQLYMALYSEQIAGMYDPKTKTMYVVSDASRIGVLGRVTLAHELTHALQDQYYDLQALGYGEQARKEYDSEHLTGVQALVEGDASLVQMHYTASLGALDRIRLIWEYAHVDLTTYSSAPKAVSAGLVFPYQDGQSFVSDLYRAGGWAAVNEAFARPPQTTEQILHPQRYRSGDAPQIVALAALTDTLGSGWHLVDQDIMGEFYTRLHLEQYLSPAAAASAAEGWDGDQYAVYQNPDRDVMLLAWRAVWDSEAELGEFVEQYKLYLDGAAGRAADVEQPGRACWRVAQEYRCLAWKTDATLVVRGPDMNIVTRALETLDESP